MIFVKGHLDAQCILWFHTLLYLHISIPYWMRYFEYK